jgi:prepilin-type N-terminal cleavage/methylation domain-containing protein
MHAAQPATFKVRPRPRRRAFTLVELILVMALLVVLLAVTMPMLSNFFTGRRANEEARRLLALTRFARQEAITRGMPLDLWLDPVKGTYGLRARFDNGGEAPEEREYQLAEGLTLTVPTEKGEKVDDIAIGFEPDGSINGESPETLTIRDPSEATIELARATVGVGYAIQ